MSLHALELKGQKGNLKETQHTSLTIANRSYLAGILVHFVETLLARMRKSIMKPGWLNILCIFIKIVLPTLFVQDVDGAKKLSIKLADIFGTGLGQPEKQVIILQDIIRSLHSEGNTILDDLESKDCAGHILEWSVRLGQGGNWYNESSWVPQSKLTQLLFC